MTAHNQGRYLVVDDDPVFTAILTKAGQKNGFSITAHDSFVKAHATLQQNQNFDAVVVDYDLNEMTGLEAVEKFSEQYPDLPMFLISSTDRPLFISTEDLPSYCGFISKWQGYRKILGELQEKSRHF